MSTIGTNVVTDFFLFVAKQTQLTPLSHISLFVLIALERLESEHIYYSVRVHKKQDHYYSLAIINVLY